MSAITFSFEFQRPQLVTANDRLHHHAKAKKVKALRQLGRSRAFDAGHKITNPVILHVRIGWPDARKRDRLNLAPSTKALVDGIAPHLLGDDNDDRIVEERWTSAITRTGCTQITLTFQETR